MSEQILVPYKKIIEKVSPLTLYQTPLDREEIPLLSGVTYNLDKSKEHEIVFYHLHHDALALEKLKKRLSSAQYGLIFINIQDVEAVERLKNIPRVILIAEDSFLETQKILLDLFYPLDFSQKKFTLIAVTGTNGKTSTSYFAYQLARQKGHAAACLGTLGLYNKNGEFLNLESGLTTPPYIELRKILYQLIEKEGHTICFMEASSHALKLGRLYGIKFHYAAWTNFQQDHLDFHQTMDDYYSSKLLLPRKYLDNSAHFFVSEGDEGLLKRLKADSIPFHLVEKLLGDDLPEFLKLDFNRKNMALAVKLVEEALKEKDFDLSLIESVPGRMENCQIAGKKVFIDFAHTPDALENILSELKKIYHKELLLVVFGCGGDRDAKKRPLMGEVVEKYADLIFVTSDNPRTEDPDKIIEEIMVGIQNKQKVRRVVDRKMAIVQAIEALEKCDGVLAIAGKGAEKYQIIGHTKIPYNDLDYVLELKASKKDNR